MRKKRISTTKSKSLPNNRRKLKSLHFLGVALSGGKANKTCLSYIEYFPEQNKIFLSNIVNPIRTIGDISADLIFHEEVQKIKKNLKYIAYNVPLTLPKCVTCKLKCPGYENCEEEEILWMWNWFRKQESNGESKNLFTPYTERCVEQYLSSGLEEEFRPQHALGANLAPLTARAHFLNRRLKLNTIEVYTRLSLWRIGRHLNIHKSHLRTHKNQLGGVEAREFILSELQKKNIAFLYAQDVKNMVDNIQAFESFICALTAVLKYKKQCEPRPREFPKTEGWIEIPKEHILW